MTAGPRGLAGEVCSYHSSLSSPHQPRVCHQRPGTSGQAVATSKRDGGAAPVACPGSSSTSGGNSPPPGVHRRAGGLSDAVSQWRIGRYRSDGIAAGLYFYHSFLSYPYHPRGCPTRGRTQMISAHYGRMNRRARPGSPATSSGGWGENHWSIGSLDRIGVNFLFLQNPKKSILQTQKAATWHRSNKP